MLVLSSFYYYCSNKKFNCCNIDAVNFHLLKHTHTHIYIVKYFIFKK